jgi:hypothetical protein
MIFMKIVHLNSFRLHIRRICDFFGFCHEYFYETSALLA